MIAHALTVFTALRSPSSSKRRLGSTAYQSYGTIMSSSSFNPKSLSVERARCVAEILTKAMLPQSPPEPGCMISTPVSLCLALGKVSSSFLKNVAELLFWPYLLVFIRDRR